MVRQHDRAGDAFRCDRAGHFALTAGTWAGLPIENSLAVPITQWNSLVTSWGGSAHIFPWRLSVTVGSLVDTGGSQIYSGSMTAGQVGSTGTGQNTGYSRGGFGSIVPTGDHNGKSIAGIYTYLYEQIGHGVNQRIYEFNLSINGTLTSNYVSRIVIGSTTLQVSNATFSVTNGISSWVWNNPALSLTNGGKYSVGIFQ